MRTAVFVGTLLAASGLRAADPFAVFETIPAAERLPRGGALTVAADGTLAVNGAPRYLTATLFYGGADECKTHTSGYSADLNWLYEAIPGYEGMQRLGIDAVGFEAGREWMKCISPKAAAFWKMSGLLPATDAFAPAFDGQLPPYVDFTAAEWGHGGLLAKDNPQLPPEAWTGGHDHHWVPYSVFHPEGRRLWLTMWREGAARCAKLPTRPWCYELMNEPAVLDTGDYARAQFRATGRRDDPIEYLKFNDEAFAALVAEGARTIRAAQPGARVTLQPVGRAAKGVDLYRVYGALDVVCSPTGGGGIPTGHFLRAVADGKPIVDGETYIGTTEASVRNALLTQFQRGFNASYTFKWCRRPRDWARGGDAAQEAPLARKLSAYYFLNPYLVPTEALRGFRLAKRDAMDVGAFFLPRDRGTPREVAVLYSRATERLDLVRHTTFLRQFETAVEELEFAHLNPDVIFEEQLRDEPARLGRYKLLVAAGVEAVISTTSAAVRAWQAKGGRLVLVGASRMAKDEYGEPNGETYPGAEVVETKGLSATEIGRRLAALAAEAGVRPTCATEGASRIEVTDARRGDARAWLVTSHEIDPVVCRFRPSARGEMTLAIRNEALASGRVVSVRRELQANATGAFTLFLRPGDVNLIVSGPRAELTARYPEGPDAKGLEPLTAEAAEAKAARALTDFRRSQAVRKGGYHVEGSRATRLDLRALANVRKLTDRLWGDQIVEGVPFTFIRTDQNAFKDAVALTPKGKSVVLPLTDKALRVYFALSGSLRGELCRADGSAEAFALAGDASEEMRVVRWTNSGASRDVRELRLAASDKGAVVYAVTVESIPSGTVFVTPERVAYVRDFSGGKLEPTWRDGQLTMTHAATPCSWSGCRMVLKAPLALPERTVLAFEVNKLPNRFGADSVAPGLQVMTIPRREKGTRPGVRYQTPRTDDRLTLFAGADGNPESWETLFVEVDAATQTARLPVGELDFQYKSVKVTDPSPLAIRNIRFEPRRVDAQAANGGTLVSFAIF